MKNLIIGLFLVFVTKAFAEVDLTALNPQNPEHQAIIFNLVDSGAISVNERINVSTTAGQVHLHVHSALNSADETVGKNTRFYLYGLIETGKIPKKETGPTLRFIHKKVKRAVTEINRDSLFDSLMVNQICSLSSEIKIEKYCTSRVSNHAISGRTSVEKMLPLLYGCHVLSTEESDSANKCLDLVHAATIDEEDSNSFNKCQSIESLKERESCKFDFFKKHLAQEEVNMESYENLTQVIKKNINETDPAKIVDSLMEEASIASEVYNQNWDYVLPTPESATGV